MKATRPFIPYYGSKWRAAKLYPSPKHRRIVEPFAGGAGYSLNYCDRDVLLVDKDPRTVGVWQYLIGVSEREFRRLPIVHHVDDAAICQEAKWLIGWWLQQARAAGPSKRASLRAMDAPRFHWGRTVRDALAAQLPLIRHWKVREGSYTSLGFEGDTTWFVDPPYQLQGRHYKHGSNDLNYKTLAWWCKQQRGQVIVCENKGADWLPFRSLAKIKNAGNRPGQQFSHEVIWP